MLLAEHMDSRGNRNRQKHVAGMESNHRDDREHRSLLVMLPLPHSLNESVSVHRI